MNRYWFIDSPAGIATLIAAGFMALIGVSIALTIWVNGNVCEQVASTTGKQVEFGWWAGCFVEVDGRLVPLDLWRSAEVAS